MEQALSSLEGIKSQKIRPEKSETESRLDLRLELLKESFYIFELKL
jgi:hypothetical protein